MFDSIQGRLVEVEPTRVVVEAGGIGYEVHVPLSTFESLPERGSSVRLLLHPVVRETEWRLYGFANPRERKAFRALLRVTGIGPAMALGLLSGLDPDEFRAAVLQGDVAMLTRVKGIGKKTAERIVVELRDAIEKHVPAGSAKPIPGLTPDLREDAIRALVALGLDAQEALRRVERSARAGEPKGLSELVRAALRS